ncbi:hypothetical protein PUN28_001509 [Cardiocondyla obscurior]|uniref:CYTH domain-containing protein n=1 Tax=Cardiocondyla obscurior TaxID=286306 RepID=A0AAW2H5G8_9HYME
MRNVEIKAVVKQDLDDLISKVEQLSETPQVKIEQHDTFFKAIDGRLKLRKFEDGTGELIFYKRPNIPGPKLSTYNKIELKANTVEPMTDLLSQSNGVVGVVKKTRLLYTIKQNRIHIDKVEGLGNFMEVECIMQEKDEKSDYITFIAQLMNTLDIKQSDYIENAYIDLLNL